jgi:hypothetical protein
MTEEHCSDCFYRMRAHDGYKFGATEKSGSRKLVTWEHCSHKYRDIPIERVKFCPEKMGW